MATKRQKPLPGRAHIGLNVRTRDVYVCFDFPNVTQETYDQVFALLSASAREAASESPPPPDVTPAEGIKMTSRKSRAPQAVTGGKR